MEKKTEERHGHPRFYEILDEISKLHSAKNRDYATKENPLGNFQRVGEWAEKYKLITPGNAALKVALLFKLKQMDACLKLIADNQVGRVEGVPERLRDVATYSMIEEILYEEGDKEK